MKNLFQLFNFVWSHQSNKGARFSAILRVLRWQISSFLMPGLIALPFVNKTFLFAKKGMTSATSAWYCGLYEFEEMNFLSDYLKPGNLFVDIGANIGVYSILAASKKAKVIAVEPVPSTFEMLKKNIILNDFQDLIEPLNIAISNKKEILNFSNNIGALNHVLLDKKKNDSNLNVNAYTLDEILNGRVPQFIKIDVEGFEGNIIKGSNKTFSNKNLLGIIIELIGGGKYYGFDEDKIHQTILSFGFSTYSYDVKKKRLNNLNGKKNKNKNTIYLRDYF